MLLILLQIFFLELLKSFSSCIKYTSLRNSEISLSTLFFNLKFTFNWRIIALQCCVGFCSTTIWISRISPSFLNLPSPPHPTAVGCHRAPGGAPCVIHQLPTSYRSYIWQWLCFNAIHSTPLLPLLCPQVCSLCLCLYSCPSIRLTSTICHSYFCK